MTNDKPSGPQPHRDYIPSNPWRARVMWLAIDAAATVAACAAVWCGLTALVDSL